MEKSETATVSTMLEAITKDTAEVRELHRQATEASRSETQFKNQWRDKWKARNNKVGQLLKQLVADCQDRDEREDLLKAIREAAGGTRE